MRHPAPRTLRTLSVEGVVNPNVLTWTDHRTFVTSEGTRFVTLGDEGSFARSLAGVMGLPSSPEQLVLLKTREDLDRLLAVLAALEPKRIVELGIFHGGSTAFLLEMTQPTMLVAVEYETEPAAALEGYLEKVGGPRTCRIHYGVDQADRVKLGEIVASDFGAEPLDLVIDDASHLGPETRASFETLFPLLRPGGLYIIEDWSWHLQGIDLPGESMETLVADLVTAAGRGPNLIAGIDIAWDVITLRRGSASVGPGEFDVSRWSDQML
jgi:predicted O-methyltransferase YrrM